MTKKKNDKWKDIQTGTKAVWSGETKPFFEGSSQVPIVQSVTFAYEDVEEWFDVAVGKKKGHIYSRNTNPTVAVFEEKVRILENAEASTSFATGMAAISNTLHTLLSPGQRVVSLKDTYGGTSKIFMDFLPRFGVEVQLCETTDHEALEKEISKGCDVVYLETPTNPTLKVMDLERLINAAQKVGAVVVVDNTFATPINQSPLELGADLVLHSATKFLGGHSDAMGGVVCGSQDYIDQIFHYREINGASLDPMAAYLLLRGIKTLELRVERQNKNALELARFLEKHPKVEEVFYPGLESHPNYEIAKRQMRGFGGVFAFSLKGGFEQVKPMLNKLEFVHLAASLGSTGTLVGPPKVTSHVETTEEERKELGIPEGLIRCSVGIENIEDLINDFEQALASL
ncbi:MAG: cystathionine gamma-synthase family protein [Balneolaceae bacterium]|nr:cystathionine gamma-synthase family protein [Balneolaceae bacterium]